MGDGRPSVEPTALGAGAIALTIDVEEWFHTCLVPEWVDPRRRPPLPHELDRLLPEVIELLAEHRAEATFFVLGEVVDRDPTVVQRILASGHEVACHADLHLRLDDRPLEAVVRGVREAKKRLEDLGGRRVRGFRAPEWSARHPGHRLLPRLVELGFDYDSSLAPVPGAGRVDNPRDVVRLRWPDGTSLLEVPPLAWGPIPANGWPSRLRSGRSLARQAERRAGAGRCAALVVHPWELSGRPSPGRIPGWGAWWVHEIGRQGFRARFADLLSHVHTCSLASALGLDGPDAPAIRDPGAGMRESG